MSENFLLSRHVMQVLLEGLQENFWYLEQQRDKFEEGGESYKLYQEMMDEDKELMDKLDLALSKE